MTLDAQTIRRQYLAQPRSKHTRLRRELIGAESWQASSGSALEFAGYKRQDQDGDGDDGDDDGDLQGDSESNDNDGLPLRGNRNGDNRNASGNLNGSLAVSNSNNRPVAGKNQNQSRPDDDRIHVPPSPTTPGIVFVTIISTQTETTTVLQSTITETLTLTTTNSPISGPSSTVRLRSPVPSSNLPTSDASRADPSSQAQLSGGSIAAIVIGIIIFITLIMAFVIRVMSFRRERSWTELDRGISRFRDEEEKLEYRPKLLSNGRLEDDPFSEAFEPTFPPRALRKTTIRFVTPPALPSAIDEDSSLPLFDDSFLRESPFSPSTNIFTNDQRNMPRPGILLNPLSPNMPNS